MIDEVEFAKPVKICTAYVHRFRSTYTWSEGCSGTLQILGSFHRDRYLRDLCNTKEGRNESFTFAENLCNRNEGD
jgi:hypothetical protein